MIIATCGHVDHGKTLLVHALTGIQTDRLEVERERGLTVDLGFAYFDIGKHRVGFVDVPGHIRFIDNMLAGVPAIHHGLLVVAADDGPMPQTLEHIAILELLQIPAITVALSKVDRVDASRVEVVTREIEAAIARGPFAGSPIIPVSAVAGTGLTHLVDELKERARILPRRHQAGCFRLAVDRAFTIKGAGLIVTGSIFSGRVNVGDEMLLQPHNMPVRVRSIHRQDRPSEFGEAGDRCALNLAAAGLRKDIVHRGDWVTDNTAPATERIDASIRVLASEARSLRHWTPVHIHTGANHVTGRVATLESDRVAPGDQALVQLVLDKPINVCRGDRLILRDQAASFTLGGGFVVEPFSPKRGRARPERIASLKALQLTDLKRRIEEYLQAQPHGFEAQAFRQAENLAESEWRRLLSSCDAVSTQTQVIATDHFERLKATMLASLAEWHKSNPQAPGATRTQLGVALAKRIPDEILDAGIGALVREQKVVASGTHIALPSHTASLTPPEAIVWKKVEPILTEAPTRPPVVHELAQAVDMPAAQLEKVLARCVQLGYLVRPVANRFFTPAGLAELRAMAEAAVKGSADGTFSVQEFRDLSGIGRNLCIEVLEYFDRTGVTFRVGDRRKLNPSRTR